MDMLAPVEATLGSHVVEKPEVFELARQQASSLPVNSTESQYPPSYAEAQALISAREEERRKAALKKDKHKQRSTKSKDTSIPEFPGAVPGAEIHSSALWLSTEGYFRDVTAADLARLCPKYDDPLQDPIFAIPFLGPAFESEEERAEKAKQRLAEEALQAKQLAQQPVIPPQPTSPPSSVAEAANGTLAPDTDKQRKSRRLGAKAAIRQAAKQVDSPAQSPRLALEREARRPEPPHASQSTRKPAPALQLPASLPNATELSQEDLASLALAVGEIQGVSQADVASGCGMEAAVLDSLATSGKVDLNGDTGSQPGNDRETTLGWIRARNDELMKSTQRQVAKGHTGVPSAAAHLPDSFQSWAEWWGALEGAPRGPRGSALFPAAVPVLEAVQAYTRVMLQRPPTAYVEQPDAMGPSSHAGAATPSLLTPQPSDPGKEAAQEATTDTASARGEAAGQIALGSPLAPSFAGTTGAGAADGLGRLAMSHLGSGQAPGNSLAALVTPAASLGATGNELEERRLSHAEAGPLHGAGAKTAKSRLANSSKRKANHAAATAPKAGRQKLGPKLNLTSIDASKNAVTAAVAAHISTGPEEGDLEAAWQQLNENAELLSMAPDDEILAEMFAIQSELLQQMAVNRLRSAHLLQVLLQDLPRQREAAQRRQQGVQTAKAWISKQRAVRRIVKREKREAAQREALKANEAILQVSPRKAPGRMRTSSLDPSAQTSRGNTPAPEAPMYDLLAERRAEDEALCAVCGGGDSNKEAENEIVFCERCDVAVHQKCYAVDVIPAGEWLCWPCKRFEEGELAAGKLQSEVRAPRWEQGVERSSPYKDLPGGGRSVHCQLCPVRRGAFRQTLDCKHWVHQVCALWHPEVRILPGNACAAIDGVNEIKPDRWGVFCGVCRRNEGAVVRCNSGHCATAFHPLCARNNGQHLTVREAGTQKLSQRAYCAAHSQSQRDKDLGSSEAAEDSAAFLRKEKRIRKHLDQANALAVEGYEGKVEGRKLLTRARLELESLRILLQRVNKREKLKRDVLRAEYEMARKRLADPEWDPDSAEGLPAPETETSNGGRGMKSAHAQSLTSSPSMQVDRELMMTQNEAAATNDKLPRGFMYVKFNSLKDNGQESPMDTS